MNVRFLEAFVWVSKLGSFKAAADKLFTTQAGISSRIATLEQQFGVRLFERDHRAVTLTYQGSELLPYAERMIELQGPHAKRGGQNRIVFGGVAHRRD
jgi:DNA-binding transcriptional LysR family regulator